MARFTSSTAPGARLPHFWLKDGRSLYDVLGPGYTLLHFSPAPELSGLIAAASAVGLPCAVLSLAEEDVPEAYRHNLVMSRPDRHVAWRSDSPPSDPERLINLLRGSA